MQHDIHLIVDRLREYKFEEDLTLVTFDEKTPQELLETLNNVLKNLSKDHDVDVTDEPIDQTAQRIFYFMPVLMFNYQGDLEQLQGSLQQGDRELMYPLLHHMLSKLPDLRKRSYVARFLTPFEVPEDMFADPEVMAKWTEYQELQQQFKETHKATDKLKGTSLQPTELKREVTQLEEEKGQLNTKINKLNLKLKKLLDENQFRELYNVTSRLRKEQEEEAKLADRYQEQSIQFKQAEARYYQSQKKLRDVEMSASDGSSGEDILRRLEEDVGMTREHVEVKLPADIVAKQQRLEHVKRLYDMPEVGLDALRNEESEIDRLRQMEQQLLEKQKAQIPTGDDKLSMFRQQAQLVANKKEKAQDRHEMLSEDLKGLEEDLAEKRAKLGHSNMPRILKGAEFQAYAGKLKEKAKTYKDLKGRLSSVIAEKGILSRTEDILKNKHGDHSEFLAKLEKQKGISGAAELQDKVEEISEKTSEVNKQKEMSLEEISRTVEKINQNIKDKKGKLAPLIKELRQVRTDFSQLESEYNEKKSLYESTAAGLATERDKLSAEVTAYQDEAKREESRFHYLNAMIESTKITLERARLEDAGRNRVGDSNQSYRELYQSRIQETENQSKKLRERQKMVKESHEHNLEQTSMFKDLRKVLGSKLHVLKREVSDTQSTAIGGGTNLMVMD